MSDDFANEVEQDEKKVANTAGNIVKETVAVGKTAAQAASGNLVGASAAAIKDSKVLQKVLLVILVPILIILVLVFAFPISLFTYFDAAVDTDPSAIVCDKDDVHSKNFEDEDKMGISSSSMFKVYINQIQACRNKVTRRYKELYNAVSGIEWQVKNWFDNEVKAAAQAKIDAHAAAHPELELDKDKVIGKPPSLHFEISPEPDDKGKFPFSLSDATQLLSIYSAQRTGQGESQEISDFLSWLGTPNSFSNTTISFKLGNTGFSATVPAWKGTFVPQYLLQERATQKSSAEFKGKKYNDSIIRKHGCAALDLLFTIDCAAPDLQSLPQRYVPDIKEKVKKEVIHHSETIHHPHVPDTRPPATLGNVNVYWRMVNGEKRLIYENGDFVTDYFFIDANGDVRPKFGDMIVIHAEDLTQFPADVPDNGWDEVKEWDEVIEHHYREIIYTEDEDIIIPIAIRLRSPNEITQVAGFWAGDLGGNGLP